MKESCCLQEPRLQQCGKYYDRRVRKLLSSTNKAFNFALMSGGNQENLLCIIRSNIEKLALISSKFYKLKTPLLNERRKMKSKFY